MTTVLLVDLSVRSGLASQLIQASLSSPRLRLLAVAVAAVAAVAAGALLRLPGFTRGGDWAAWQAREAAARNRVATEMCI